MREADYAKLIEIGIALSAERNHERLLENILLEAKALCHADGGTLYLCGNMVEFEGIPEPQFEAEADGKYLKFEIMRTDSLGIAKGGTTGEDIPFPPLSVYDPKTGEPNHKNVASHVALTGETVNIPDVYEATEFDFTGPRKFDQSTGYRSKSFLNVPLKNHSGEVIGVLQLLNAQAPDTGESIPFSSTIVPMIEALASQAAVAVDNQMLLEAQARLMDSFIMVIGGAIDAKSPYTGGHCARVPELARMMAEAAAGTEQGPLKDFTMDEGDFRELHLASWLHDCGKVVTPEYVVDKATKLETIHDRIHEVRMRFEVLKREAEIAYWRQVAEGGDRDALKAELDATLARIDDDYAFVAECNVGGEFMAEDKVQRLKDIARHTWTRTLDDRIGISHEELRRKEVEPARPLPVVEQLLQDKPEHIFPRDGTFEAPNSDKYGFNMDVPKHLFNRGEVYNLSIGRGTLTAEDRYIIQNHIVQTIVMLGQLPFPKHLRNVPEYAGAHHETLIGTGYPKKLTKENMSVPARIMALADVFEALTAADRPYKKPKTLSESIKILSFMVKDQHIDADLFRLMLESGVYKEYAERFLRPDQLDEVDLDKYLK
ncbi:MAG: GAF domain-containing protein [Alphaproteobacteria bacterium]|nr:GAF domain-containing protein [Alphaproteobacteria bacterium]MBF0249576.1 GAF domain-containing protein [Alphaproteobacteria bacterium]